MTAVVPEPLRLAPIARPPADPTGRRIYLGVLLSVVLATLVGVLASRSPHDRGLRALPPEQRAALLARTVDDLRQFCGSGHAPALDDHCRELAAFASRFPECRGECEALARPFLAPTPTR
jgi:hypothetical protein